ncbi:carboxypeptidase regulatory-like domain-containing protein [Nocardioides sp. SR21]|uniref:carboxypeptidase regulatory-like domain-containing protein n=1 Tax=Nocardioides sp. SR21 TaxID=2919501 RepID=UPI001FAAE280|nr:carboxypeptidase regulatory-like domain-containing protein [Nocardioides sp. SR21]
MTLIEVVVAIGLFAIMSTSVLSVLGSAITMTREDKARLAAVNLASRELEIVRDTFSSVLRGPEDVGDATNPDQLPGGQANGPIVVDGVPFTVVRDTRWEAVGAGASSPCDNGTSDELAYLHVTVKVSWPDLGSRPPVTMDTVMTPPKGTYSALQTQSHIGMMVIDSLGNPKPGVQVTAKNSLGQLAPLQVTATDGCALLENLPAGSWTVTASNPGFVSLAGDATAQTTVHLQAGQLWRGVIQYDQAARILPTITAPEGYQLPAGAAVLPVTIGNSGLQPIGTRTFADSQALVAAQLWPFPSGYVVWAGGCEDGNPALTGEALPVPAVAGTTTPAVVSLGAVEVHAPAGTSVVATHAADRLCPTGATVQLGTTNAEGVLMTSLPFGTWTVGPQPDVAVGQGAPVVVNL